jgi:hypothetical protein
MKRNNQLARTAFPELERTELSEQEEQIFNQMIQEVLPDSAEETQRFLDGHRQEAQGQ